MKDKRFSLGIAATAVWVVFAGFMSASAEHPSKLNEAQLPQETASVREERERRLDALRPKFVAIRDGNATSGRRTDLNVQIHRIGALATA